MVDKKVIQNVWNIMIKSNHFPLLLRQKGNGEDLLFNYIFKKLYKKNPVYVKGYYKKARAGIIKNYTGIDSPYEIPDNPELTLNTDNQTLEESVQAVLALLKQKVIL